MDCGPSNVHYNLRAQKALQRPVAHYSPQGWASVKTRNQDYQDWETYTAAGSTRTFRSSTWGEVYHRARALAEMLQTSGLRRGDRVATLMWNHYAHLEAYFGIPAAGGVLQTLNLRLAPGELAYIANHAGDRLLIVDDVLLPLFEKFRDSTKFERVIVVPLT